MPGQRAPHEPLALAAPAAGWADATGIEPVEIAAGRLQLRPPRESEALEALAMLLDPEVVQWNPAPGVHDEDSARAWCRRGADWSDGTHATFSILDATTGRLLGNVSLHHVDRARAAADIGYRVTRQARGHGVATAAVRAVSGWAIAALGIERIQLFHAVVNVASCRIAEKSQYALEATLPDTFVGSDGLRYDEHRHALVTASSGR
jgi:RimJ/RimL family protein N-acetyltransferase